MSQNRLTAEFYQRDVLLVAPELLGKQLVRALPDGLHLKHLITEVEAYKGTGDLGCHASKGKTERNKVMFEQGGLVYVYLIYGMYWMLNVVTSTEDNPEAVLIRGISEYSGPGRLTKHLQIDKSFYAEDLITSPRIWIEDIGIQPQFETTPRIGIDYAGPYWANIPWRFVIKNNLV
ncbi:MAG: DNA-3-methyladenine glycosylase [Bacteroidales bacterium]|nr:DNA-3-methyladenine glycosylase [Bacteroidales bacterium]